VDIREIPQANGGHVRTLPINTGQPNAGGQSFLVDVPAFWEGISRLTAWKDTRALMNANSRKKTRH